MTDCVVGHNFNASLQLSQPVTSIYIGAGGNRPPTIHPQLRVTFPPILSPPKCGHLRLPVYLARGAQTGGADHLR